MPIVNTTVLDALEYIEARNLIVSYHKNKTKQKQRNSRKLLDVMDMYIILTVV